MKSTFAGAAAGLLVTSFPFGSVAPQIYRRGCAWQRPGFAERRDGYETRVEPGLDLHEWETRWEELNESAAGAPDEALPEFVRHVEEMLLERGYHLGEPVTQEGADYE